MRGLRYIGITQRTTNDLSHSLAATAFDRPGFAAPARAFITHKVTNDNILFFSSGQFPSFSLGKIQGFSKTEENLCNIFINSRLRSICENYPPTHDWFPPYKGTSKYAGEGFDHGRFYDWCANQKALTIISEYNMPESFTCIAKKEKTVTKSAISVAKAVESLFIPSHQKELYNDMKTTLF